jgi:succinate-semialdehyde dehydrogenase/glutarate-semialdehyde dehydrogenase
MGIASINPATGAVLQIFDPLSDEQLQAKLALAQHGFEQGRWGSVAQRSESMQQVAEILLREKATFGRLITLEMGKTLAAAMAEVEKSAWVCRYYAEQAAEFLQDRVVETDASRSFVRYQPLGVILAVMPWNFPFWQVFRCAAPAVMAGNTVVLKHASNVPQSALQIEEIFTQAGFPAGVFQTLLVGSDRVAQIIADERVKAAALTGSEAAGSSLASHAGKHIKKTVLELGGSDPFIVLESADLETAVSTAVTARLISNGQSCIAAKRFILQESIADSFQQRLLQKYQALRVGDPLDATTDIGPLATAAILQELDGQVSSSTAQGARALIGGKPLDRPGNYYPPTILTEIPPASPAATEEIFGPVALLFRVKTCEEAIRLANRSPLGLGASAWTTDPAEQEDLVNQIEAGSVFINGMVKSDPRLPFGGIKHSGYGRELSVEGMHEFVNVKTVWIR